MQGCAMLVTLSFLWLNFLMLPPTPSFEACLPKDIKSTEVLSVETKKSGHRDGVAKKFTVKDKLKELKARCRKGKLVDASGREIRFYRLAGCWGNPPADYLEILERQQQEISKLKKRYTVIEIPCDPPDSPRIRH